MAFLIENLHAILHTVRNPDVAVAIDGHSLGPCEITRAIAGLSEGAYKLAVGVKDFNTVVIRIGHIEITFGVHRHPGGL